MRIFLFIFLVTSNLYFGQEKVLLKLLNQELKKEVKNQFKSDYFEGDTLFIVKPYTINEDKILSFEIRKRLNSGEDYQIIKQEVPLKMVRNIGKDLQIIFEAESETVKTTYMDINQSKKTEVLFGNLFFLYFKSEKNNEYFGNQLLSAFKNAGYNVTKEYWYD